MGTKTVRENLLASSLTGVRKRASAAGMMVSSGHKASIISKKWTARVRQTPGATTIAPTGVQKMTHGLPNRKNSTMAEDPCSSPGTITTANSQQYLLQVLTITGLSCLRRLRKLLKIVMFQWQLVSGSI